MLSEKLLTCNQVCDLTSLSKATIYRKIASKIFPKPIKISTRRVAWRQTDIIEWLDNCPYSPSFNAGGENND